mmetsp:Transcript_14961/g.30565  ORF Transcript_14961/g.30565 Transcript_14961/m.30565 type:complete len:458 (+) Transcript_14961:10-1383(+)
MMHLSTLLFHVFLAEFSRLTESFNHHKPTSLVVPRITLNEFLSSPIYKSPVLISGICSPESVESLAEKLIDTFGAKIVQMQQKIKYEEDERVHNDPTGFTSRPRPNISKELETKNPRYATTTEIYDIPLEECIDYMMESRHTDSFFAFCEGLLPNPTTAPTTSDRSKAINTGENASDDVSCKLRNIREAPFPKQENWFDYFPRSIQPTDAIILAGAGATSTLHRDPFEWTGTSFCLEGTKIWRFVIPPLEEEGGGGVSVVDEAFGSYRLDSIAWEEDEEGDSVVLSAGWQSDMTLFESIRDRFPTAFEWATMEENDQEAFLHMMEEVGTSVTSICPSAEALDALIAICDNRGKEASIIGSSTEKKILFQTAIQQPGDLLIIPAHCWHQTYAPVPSIAVASQRCSANIDGANVVRHVLDMAALSNHDKPVPHALRHSTFEEGIGKKIVSDLFNHLSMI